MFGRDKNAKKVVDNPIPAGKSVSANKPVAPQMKEIPDLPPAPSEVLKSNAPAANNLPDDLMPLSETIESEASNIPANEPIPEFSDMGEIADIPCKNNPIPLPEIGEIEGPMFISLHRYKELKTTMGTLRMNSKHLRATIDSFKKNKSEGTKLLEQGVNNLDKIEESIENLNSTLKV